MKKGFVISLLALLSVCSLAACGTKVSIQKTTNSTEADDNDLIVSDDTGTNDKTIVSNTDISPDEAFDDSLDVKDIADMSADELDAYEVEFNEQEESIKQYEDIKSSPTERDSDGSILISFPNSGIDFVYIGTTDVQVVTEEGKDFAYLSGIDDVSSVSIGIYSGKQYEEAVQTIVNKDHLHNEKEGFAYYTATTTDNKTEYYAFVDCDEYTIGVINVQGNCSIDDVLLK